MTLAARLADAWYRPRLTPLAAALLPLSWIYGGAIALRRLLYRSHILASRRMARPVVVIGNLTVGGSGKTPATIALARALAAQGAVPGIVCRGYGGSLRGPKVVRVDDDPAEVGDEALLLAGSECTVVIGRERAGAAEALLAADPRCTVILCDDGLQHYALARDVEIVMIDDTRGFGNGRLLPAGPLREPPTRLAEVDAIAHLASAGTASADGRETLVVHRAQPFRRVDDDAELADAAFIWRGRRIRALAGIANPQRFFALLRTLGVDAVTRSFPDHHPFTADDLPADADIIVMTQKDAVKCRRFADPRCYYLPIVAELDAALVTRVRGLIGAA